MEPTALTGAQTLHPNSEQNNVPTIEYSEAAKKYILFKRQRMIAARDLRDTPKAEWDDMPFLKWYDVMKKADDQYVAPRKNKQDTSINTGTIRDKDTTLVEYANKYDFEPVAQVYDDSDEMLEELAETGEDLVRKSLLLEDMKSKAKLIYRSMAAFGTALVEDAWVEKWVIKKTLDQGFRAGMGSDKATWTEKLVKEYDGCQAKLWDLRKCYFGDIRKFFMNGPNGQPYFFVVEYENYDTVKQTFQNWDRWKYVPTTTVMTPEMMSSANVFTSWWTLRPVSMNAVEKIWYFDPIANEVSLTLNGVEMLPIMDKKMIVDGVEKIFISGYPLTEVSPSGAIPFAKYDLEPMHDFAYSKGQAAKMRVWGDVENMFVKLMIGMMKQKAKPTLGNKSGRMFGEEVTDPATVINDIREGDLFPVLPNYTGASQSDFSMYEMVKKELDKNSVDRSFQGTDNTEAEKTATQDMNEMKAQSLKVAALFDGIISGNNQLYWLRTYNIMKNWTKPIDQRVDAMNKQLVDIYRTVTMPSQIDGGQKAMKRIVFTKDTTMTSEDVHQKEIDASKETGGEVRIAYLHPEKFATAKMSWFYTCVPVPNGSDPLGYMMFAKQVNDAIAMFGPDSLNVKKLKHKFAVKTGEDFDTWFISEQELQQKQQQAQIAQSQNNPAGVSGGPAGPTMANAVSGKTPAQPMASVMR